MKIKRTYKQKSLKHGQSEIVDESVVRTVAGQTRVAHHEENACKPADYKGAACFYCCEPAMVTLRRTGKLETFFSVFEVVEA